MNAYCPRCERMYDDTYRSTICPHNRFNMHTIMALGNEVYVVATLEDMEAVRLHWSGVDTTVFERIEDSQHIHRKDGVCLSPNVSGRLEETE